MAFLFSQSPGDCRSTTVMAYGEVRAAGPADGQLTGCECSCNVVACPKDTTKEVVFSFTYFFFPIPFGNYPTKIFILALSYHLVLFQTSWIHLVIRFKPRRPFSRSRADKVSRQDQGHPNERIINGTWPACRGNREEEGKNFLGDWSDHLCARIHKWDEAFGLQVDFQGETARELSDCQSRCKQTSITSFWPLATQKNDSKDHSREVGWHEHSISWVENEQVLSRLHEPRLSSWAPIFSDHL